MLVELLAAGPAYAGEGGQQGPARLEDALKRPNGGAYVVDEMQRLRADDAIEDVRWYILSTGEVSDDGRPPVSRVHVEHVADRHAVAAVFSGKGGVFDLQHPPSNVLSLAGEKILDVVAINRPPPIQTELAADRSQPPEIPET